MPKKYIFAYLPGWRIVGFQHYTTIHPLYPDDDPDEREYIPFGAMPGWDDPFPMDTWSGSEARTEEEAVEKLRGWMGVIGLRGEPIVADEIPDPPETTSGAWTKDSVREIIRDEMVRRGICEEDLRRDDDEEEDGGVLFSVVRWDTSIPRPFPLIIRLPFVGKFPVLPHTTEADIRGLVGRWVFFQSSEWKNEPLYDEERWEALRWRRELLPTTYKKWREKKGLIGYLSVLEAAQKSGYDRKHLARLCQQGKLEGAIKKNGGWWIPEASLDAYEPGPQGFAAHPEKNPRRKRNGDE
ncbi:MAG: helix-turn-helix domain-containing protein [Fretibacterium sp.]|nr:helix-turn-helix domain-containing protein [Fretibacterium sp.]